METIESIKVQKKNWKIKLGIGLMVFSGVFFGALIFIPMLGIENSAKIKWSTASFITGEIVFWLGGLLVGKELFTKYKSYLNPVNWFKKKDSSSAHM